MLLWRRARRPVVAAGQAHTPGLNVAGTAPTADMPRQIFAPATREPPQRQDQPRQQSQQSQQQQQSQQGGAAERPTAAQGGNTQPFEPSNPTYFDRLRRQASCNPYPTFNHRRVEPAQFQYPMLDGVSIALHPMHVYESWVRAMMARAARHLSAIGDGLAESVKEAEAKLDELLCGSGRPSLEAVAEVMDRFYNSLFTAMSQAQSQLEVAAEDAVEYLRRRREVEDDDDWEWAGYNEERAPEYVQPFDELMGHWDSFEAALSRLSQALGSERAELRAPLEVNGHRLPFERSMALLRAEQACGVLTLCLFGRFIVVPSPATAIFAVVAGAGHVYLGEQRKKLGQRLDEIERLHDLVDNLRKLGVGVTEKAEELRQHANHATSFGPEAAEDFATGMETGLGDLAGQRGVVLDYVKQLGARLRF